MPIFNWTAKQTCGDEPAESCEALQEKSLGRSALVAGSDNCPKELVVDSKHYPAFVFSVNDGLTELRNGSAEKPLGTPNIIKHPGESVARLKSQRDDGTWFDWLPSEECYDRRLVYKQGVGFTLIYDQNSNVFDNACIGTLNDVDYIAGAITFEDCDGNTKVQLKFFPKSELIAAT